jgi:phenylacetate-CoA ligase
VKTGGSTGTPLSFYYERGVTRAVEWAFIKALWDRIGYHFTDKCIVLRGQSLGPDRLWQPTFFGRWLTLSSYRMTDQYLPRYIEKIRQYRPRFIQGYPSSITIHARYMKARKVEPFPGLRAVICTSETLYPEQKKLFEDVFQCRVFSFYGLTERVALAGACEHSDHYHTTPEYGVLELIGPDDREVKGDGKGVEAELEGELPTEEVIDRFCGPGKHVNSVNCLEVRSDYVRILGPGLEEYVIRGC